MPGKTGILETLTSEFSEQELAMARERLAHEKQKFQFMTVLEEATSPHRLAEEKIRAARAELSGLIKPCGGLAAFESSTSPGVQLATTI